MSQTPSVDEPVIYDSARNSRLCYDEGIAALRERLERSKVVIGDCTLYNEDCRFILPTLRGIDAVVTDPPYGIGIAKNPVRQKHNRMDWDSAPPGDELMAEVIKSAPIQVIWGGNYFSLPPSQRFLVWDKKQPFNFSLAMCEQAWTNLRGPAKMFRKSVTSFKKDHPTQKPVDLMEWCLDFIPDAKTILDPFAGSGTTGVACVNRGRAFVGIEREAKYFETMCQRIENAYAQGALSLPG